MAERTAFPLRVASDGRMATVEQDSDEDVAQCLLNVGRTRPGERWDEPALGVEPLEFTERPLDLTQMTEALRRYEPRRTVEVIERTPILSDAVAQVTAELEVTFDGD